MTLLHEMLDATAARLPGFMALRHRGRDFTYEEVRRRSECVASGLAAQGIARGDRVVAYLQNRPEMVEVALALSRLGAIFVPANPMLKLRQLRHILRDSGAKLLVAPYAAPAALADLQDACPSLATVVVCDSAPEAASGMRIRLLAYDELLLPAVSRDTLAIDRDPAAILYTSGSTGSPKGVVISHHNLVSGARSVASYLGNEPSDRLLAALPLSFDYGFSQVTTAFSVGACAVLTHFSMAAALIQDVVNDGITGIAGVPTMWQHLAENEWPERAVRTVRYITNSGGALSTPVVVKLRARLRMTRIYSMYGLTEAFRSTYLEPERLASHPGSIGKAIPNQEVLVLRPDGTQCAPGEIGELVHRGSLVTLGYWNDPEKTRRRYRPLPGGNPSLNPELVVYSGDLVRRDDEGYLYFIGRDDHLIKTSGHRVSPSEIEEVVAEVPGVTEAVAIGLPDEILGQRIAVGVVAQGAAAASLAETIRHHCRMQLPAYMVPMHVCVLDSIARNPNGKPDRAALLPLLKSLTPADVESAHQARLSLGA